jgi:hypothetical protein
LLELDTPWAARLAYGLTGQLWQDVLPLDEPLHAVTMRQHGRRVAPRREAPLGEEQGSFLAKGPAEVAALPMPHGPLTVGRDGGAVKAPGEQGAFEVLAGKRRLACPRGEEPPEPVSSTCFAVVQTYAQQPKRRLGEGLQSPGHQLQQPSTFVADGGDSVRDLPL